MNANQSNKNTCAAAPKPLEKCTKKELIERIHKMEAADQRKESIHIRQMENNHVRIERMSAEARLYERFLRIEECRAKVDSDRPF